MKDEGWSVVSDRQRIAKILNRFFDSALTVEGPGTTPILENGFSGLALEDVDVSPQKVEGKLAVLNPRSSPGPDGIRPIVLRNSARVLSHPLSILFRKSLNSGFQPTDWKTGEITPIFKKGEKKRRSTGANKLQTREPHCTSVQSA